MTINEWIEQELQNKTFSFWGTEYNDFAGAELVARVFGDGQQPMRLIPLATRPHHYVVRVDSALNEDDALGFVESELLDAIEEEFGGVDEDEQLPWPALDTTMGWMWRLGWAEVNE